MDSARRDLELHLPKDSGISPYSKLRADFKRWRCSHTAR